MSYREHDRREDQPPPENPLAVAGLVLSALGLLTAGLLSPIGLFVSAKAALDPPRRVAFMGIGAGLLGCAILTFMLASGGFGRMFTALGFSSANAPAAPVIPLGPGPLQVAGTDLSMLRQIAIAYSGTDGRLPVSMQQVTDAGGAPTLDPWGKPYRMHFSADRKQCWFTSDGPDGLADSLDDLESGKVP